LFYTIITVIGIAFIMSVTTTTTSTTIITTIITTITITITTNPVYNRHLEA
jgi:hypothetical protein